MIVERPLVSVVTPVFNGEAYLRACVESVLAQTYPSLEYVIVDNCSTDHSQEIAEHYAALDTRIRVVKNPHCLPMLKNWNHALRQISASSRYCKVLHADDLMFPDCVERMVEVGEAHPTVGVISAYRIDEDHVNLDVIPYETTFISGKDLCRRRLLGQPDLVGSPSSLMLRADLVRGRERFYNEDNLHADSEVCLDLLRHVDFGFVHQVLTYTRRHNEAATTAARKLNTHKASHYVHFVKYGRYFLSDEEYARRLKQLRKTYYRFLAAEYLQSLLDRHNHNTRDAFWGYHRAQLTGLGQSLSKPALIASCIAVLYNQGLNSLKV
ncbi:MAG: glycosyltransferase family 2 protein [Gammaproteobacteria bacterium]